MAWSVGQVESLLEAVLFESPTAAAANANQWVARAAADSSLSSLSGLVTAMTASPEAGIAEQVYRLYLGALGRAPAAAELGFYVGIAETGLTAAQITNGVGAVSASTWNQIAADFSNSPEFQGELAGGDAISLLYKNILGRSAASSELGYYHAQLQAGAPMSAILQDFVNSPEYQLQQMSGIVTQLELFGGVTAAPATQTATTSLPVLPSGPSGLGPIGPQPIVITSTGGPVTANGGSSVTITDNVSIAANATGGPITVGATTQPTGAVSITQNIYQTDTSGLGTNYQQAIANSGPITVSGGTSVAVTLTVGGSHAALVAGTEVDLGAITINGGTQTTSVSVAVPAFVLTNVYEGPATPGVAAVTGATAAPGVTGVTSVSAVTQTSSFAPVAGFFPAGTLTVTDAHWTTPTTASNSITSLTLDNVLAAVFNGNALTTLNVANTDGFNVALTVNNAAASAATNTTLTLNAGGGAVQLTDTNNEISVLDVVTSGAVASGVSFVGTGLTAINVSGTQVESLGTLTPTVTPSLSAISVSGGAGLTADISAFPGTVNGSGHLIGDSLVTVSSTGTITLTLDASATKQQSFTGGSGTDVITIDSDVTQYAPIVAGSGANNELILTSTIAGAYTLAGTGTYATGFTVLGIGSGAVNGGTIDLAGWASSIQRIDVQGNDGDVTIKHFAGHEVDFTNSFGYFSGFFGPAASFVLGTNDSTGPSDLMTVNIFGNFTGGATVETLTLADEAGAGVGTLNVVSGSTAFDNPSEIITLNDNGLSVLTVTGPGGLVIGTLNETATPAASLTVTDNDTNAFGFTISSVVDAALTSVTAAGTNWVSITAITDSATSLALTNSGSSSFKVGTITDSSLTSLTLGANVSLGQAGSTLAESFIGLQDSSTAGVTVTGGSDNAHVSITLGGAGAGNTDSVTVGNGNDYIVDKSIAAGANVQINLGTGSNYIVLGQGATATSASFTVILGNHGAAGILDELTVGTAGANFSTAANVSISGAKPGDVIIVADNANLTVSNGGTVAGLATLLADASAAHEAVYGNIGGNTFIVETSAANVAAQTGANTSVIEVMGTHAIGSAGGGGILYVIS